MTEGLEAVTRQVLGLALDAAGMRQQAIATNIANANVQGFVPQRVSFEDQLDDARRQLSVDGSVDAASLSHVRPMLFSSEGADAAGVRLDSEAAEMARNAVHYQALVKGLSRHMAILALAASDGRK
ncbi:MAG: flagellar basal body protein [Bordetella sp.]|nr:flagellar basal body protein [Bordetella sp.]